MNTSSKISKGLVVKVFADDARGNNVHYFPTNEKGYFEITKKQIIKFLKEEVGTGAIFEDDYYDRNKIIKMTTIMDENDIKRLGIVFTGDEDKLNKSVSFIIDEKEKKLNLYLKSSKKSVGSFKVGTDNFVVIRGLDFLGLFKVNYNNKVIMDIVLNTQEQSNFKLIAFGKDAKNHNFVLLEEQIGEEVLTYPIYIKNDTVITFMAEFMNKKDKIKASSKFKKKIIKAYRKNSYGKNKVQFKILGKKDSIKFYASAEESISKKVVTTLFNPEIISGKKLTVDYSLNKLIFTNKKKIFKLNMTEYFCIKLAYDYNMFIFQPPRGWEINKIAELGY